MSIISISNKKVETLIFLESIRYPGMIVQTSTFAFHMQYSLLGLCIPRANRQVLTPGLNKNIEVLTGN